MLQIRQQVNLRPLHTFGIDTFCDHFAEINSLEDFSELVQNEIYRSRPRLFLGGGSNLLFTQDFHGLVIKINLKGISIVSETDDEVIIKAAAGEVWNELVMYCIGHNFAGLENLSLIPGCVGASPMQNIGAYGVEIKDVFKELEAYSTDTGEKRIFRTEDCDFGYRESVFKRKYKDKYLIASVSFTLKKQATLNTRYGAINAELEAMNINDPTIRDVSNAVIRIRRGKLPDPKETGNAGSFFKNPEVAASNYLQLKEEFPDLVAYLLPNGNYKLAAGWLIERCGLKGYEHGGAAVHAKQALVLINKDHCTGEAVYELSGYVLQKVFDTFGVTLEREVNII